MTDHRSSNKDNQHPAPVLEIVRIRTEKFQCLAYRDPEGRWWDKNHRPITEKILSWEQL